MFTLVLSLRILFLESDIVTKENLASLLKHTLVLIYFFFFILDRDTKKS